ncbi:MAG: hypothetical protein DRP45_10760, partial [Candidatus Zixiibacteriota bacterium]
MRKLSIFLAFILVLTFGQTLFAGGTGSISISNITGHYVEASTDYLDCGPTSNTHMITMYWDVTGEVGDCVNYAPTCAFTMWGADQADGTTVGTGAAFGGAQIDVFPDWATFGFASTFLNHFDWNG